jgi:hypothetical protein
VATVRYALENPIETKTVAVAKGMGLIGLKLTPRGQRGWPDRIFFIPGGRPLLIEFKRPGDDPDPLQGHRRTVLLGLGYDVEIHDTAKHAVQAIKDAIKRAKDK